MLHFGPTIQKLLASAAVKDRQKSECGSCRLCLQCSGALQAGPDWPACNLPGAAYVGHQCHPQPGRCSTPLLSLLLGSVAEMAVMDGSRGATSAMNGVVAVQR